MPLMEEGGSTPKLPNLHQFSTAREGPLTLEEAKLQMQEIKRLDDLKAEKEKSEKKLKRMIDEYNHYITIRDDPLPITKFSYRVSNASKEETMRITRNNQPLNLKVYDKFVLKKLGFSEWLELHVLASNRQSASNDQLLKNLKANCQEKKQKDIGVVGSHGLVINEPESGIFVYNESFDLVFQREN
ncbi:hypothetical protein Tco_1355151 [Tanacetum coccineum]